MSLHEPTEYNQYIGQETLNYEYKEFTFNLAGLVLDSKLAEQYCYSNKFEFNKNVIFNLKKYFKVYLGKYACGYFNSGIDGECYIGINDFGIVKGIPFKGRIPSNNLKESIYKILNMNIKHQENIQINWENLVQIQIIKIQSPKPIQCKQNPKFVSYLEEKAEHVRKSNEFVEKTNQWRIRMGFSLNKLVDLANNPETRSEIVKFIKSHDPTNPVIAQFESDFVLEYKCHEDIIQIKDNPIEPYYWVTKWKDMIINSIKEEKPVLNSTFNAHNTAINLLISANEMIPYWLTYNSNMNLYVIQIKFFGSKLDKKPADLDQLFPSTYNNFAYKDFNTKKWLQCYRTVLANGEPVCLPM
jgi:hypothetical protein